jgi:hypothetical protein
MLFALSFNSTSAFSTTFGIENESLFFISILGLKSIKIETEGKPKNITLILAALSVNFDVIILINHKWAYVSFINPEDNLPQTGWILKKYLNLP